MRVAQIKQFFWALENRSAFLEKIGITISSITLIAALYTLMSEWFWPSFLTELSEGLTRIAIVTEMKGSSFKKTSIDTLWLPLFAKASVYFGDTIRTSKESAVNIEFNPKSSIRVEEESLVRIKVFDGRPMIRLSVGAIKTNFLEDQIVLIKAGPKIKEILIQKGSYLIKNDDSMGIQITQFTQEIERTAGEGQRQQTKAKADDSSQANERSEEDETDEDEESITGEIEQFSYRVPYPEDETVFLIISKVEILVAAQIVCPDSCSLKIFRNQTLLSEMRSRINEPALTKISADQAIPGVYEWEFESKTINHRSKFYIKNYSTEALSKAIEAGKPIEIQ